MRFTAVLLYLGLAVCQSALGQPSGFYLRDGDTVVFYGDSITNQRIYTDFIEAYVLTRFPKLRLNFINSGFSGDRVAGGYGGNIDQRLQHDVFPYHPSVVTILLGMNDGEYQPYDAGIFAKYCGGYRYLVEKLKATIPHLRLTLLEPSAYDDFTRPPEFPGGYNSVLIRFGQFVRRLARSEGAEDADLNAPVAALLRAANAADPATAAHLIPDRVHPSAGVHMVMAASLLQAWHAPSLVTSVEIDAASGTIAKADNTAVDSLDRKNGLRWTQTDLALPMPLDLPEEAIEIALRYFPIEEALNREMLEVRGLSAGRYRLRIDEEDIGTFDADQLAGGINLAAMKTPMSEQAQVVLDLTHRHNNLHFARWRMVEDALKDYKLAKTRVVMEDLNALEAEVIGQQRFMATPRPHRYVLTAQ